MTVMAEKTKPAPKKTHEGERIAKVLSRAGVASRREAERMIEIGEVTVNGKVITSPALNVKPTDKITVSGHALAEPEPARLWLYYKPDGLVTSNSDEKGRDTVFDNLPEDMPRVMSVGRLDLNSEGLLLLTNDGELKRKLELPSTGWLRKYRVRVNGNPTDPDLEPLRRGLTVEGEQFQPMVVVLDRIQGANAWLTVGIREGKNREIRRAMNAINLTVNRLIRVSYGPFRLGDLQPGQVEEVKGKVLRDQLGSKPELDPDDKPARRVTRPARPKADATAKPATGKPATAKPAAKPTSRALKPAMKDLSQAWTRATKPAEDGAKPAAKPKPKSTAGMTRLDAPSRKPGYGPRSRPKSAPKRGE
jgi:23S rRNA pseudouridine2605 synthase